jgi:nucleoid-associated protein YgaU
MAAVKNQPTTIDTLKTYESQLSTIFGFIIVVAIGVGLLFLLRKTSLTPTPKISDLGGETSAENLMKDQASQAGKYVVKAGDNLWKIAQSELQNGYQWTTIANANGIKSPYVVTEGQTITIPSADPKIENLMAKETTQATTAPITSASPTPLSGAQAPKTDTATPAVTPTGSTHKVVANESLWKIAVAEYKDGYKWVEIYQANKKLIGSNPGIIREGQELVLPSGK